MSRAFYLTFFLAAVLACGGPPQRSEQDPASGSQEIPELTKEIINERINETGVYDVLPESGTGGPISWSFDENEPKEIVVVNQQTNGANATVILDIKTSSAPRSRVQRYLAGQIRTEWQLTTGWVLRRWEIVDTENISMKYTDLPKASPSPIS